MGASASRMWRIFSIRALNSSIGGDDCGAAIEEKFGVPPTAPPAALVFCGMLGNGALTSMRFSPTNSKFFGIASIWVSDVLRKEYESEKEGPIS